MTVLADLYATGSVIPWGEDAEPPFRAGNVGLFQNGRWATPGIRTVDFNWDVVKLPDGPGRSRNWLFWGAYVVNANTEDPEAAWQLVEALTTADVQAQVAELGANIPSRVSQDALDAFLTFTPPDNNQAFLDGLAENPATEGPLWAGSWPEYVSTLWTRDWCSRHRGSVRRRLPGEHLRRDRGSLLRLIETPGGRASARPPLTSRPSATGEDMTTDDEPASDHDSTTRAGIGPWWGGAIVRLFSSLPRSSATLIQRGIVLDGPIRWSSLLPLRRLIGAGHCRQRGMLRAAHGDGSPASSSTSCLRSCRLHRPEADGHLQRPRCGRGGIPGSVLCLLVIVLGWLISGLPRRTDRFGTTLRAIARWLMIIGAAVTGAFDGSAPRPARVLPPHRPAERHPIRALAVVCGGFARLLWSDAARLSSAQPRRKAR